MSLDDWLDFDAIVPKVPKRKADTSSKRRRPAPPKAVVPDDLWCDRHEPCKADDLAVHKKKVDEVRAWLTRSLATVGQVPEHQYQCNRLLLLSGPSGCGKTATVKALAKELRCELVEWVNPQTQPEWDFDSHQGRSQFSESTLGLFKNFLLRTQRYPTLSIGGAASDRKIILIEEFPPVFFMAGWHDTFHELLRSFAATSRYPLAMVVSQQKSGKLQLTKLFSKQFLSSGLISEITFNPVPVTYITKALKRIVGIEGRRTKAAMPTETTLKTMANGAEGDIRNAVHSLQFYCLKPDPSARLQKKKRKRSKSAAKDPPTVTLPAGLGGRDSSIILFHALGKIFNAKRASPEIVDTELPPHLAHHERLPLVSSNPPESAVERAQVDPAKFGLFLHENYPLFFTDTDDMLTALDYLACADLLQAEWEYRQVQSEYSSAVACRGVVFANQHPPAKKWQPTHKPQLYDVERQAQDLKEELLCAFRPLRTSLDIPSTFASFSSSELILTVAPYLHQISAISLPQALATPVSKVSRFSKYGHRSHQTSMRETDLDQYEESDEGDMGEPSVAQTEAAASSTDATTGLSQGFDTLGLVDDIESFSSDDES